MILPNKKAQNSDISVLFNIIFLYFYYIFSIQLPSYCIFEVHSSFALTPGDIPGTVFFSLINDRDESIESAHQTLAIRRYLGRRDWHRAKPGDLMYRYASHGVRTCLTGSRCTQTSA